MDHLLTDVAVTALSIGVPLLTFVGIFAVLYRFGKKREAAGGRSMRGRISPRHNVVPTGLVILGVPIVMFLISQLTPAEHASRSSSGTS